MKKLIFIIFLIFIFFIKTPIVYASDLNISCGSGICTPALTSSLFPSSEVWVPNKTLSKTVKVTNTSNKEKVLAMQPENSSASDDLDTVLNLTVTKSNGELIWAGTLNDFYETREIQLGTLNSGLFEEYSFTVSLGNVEAQFQSKQTSFDLNLGFLSESASSNSNSSDNSNNNTTQTPVCNESKPSTPSNLYLNNVGFGKVSLSWNAPEGTYTYFLIAYSDNVSSPKWGNPNIGNQTSYIVSGLGTGTYWFWVRAGNGCKPGDFIGPVSIFLEGGGNSIASGFSSGVLSATDSGNLKTTYASNKPVDENNNLFNRIWTFIKRLFQSALNFIHSY